MRYFKTVTNFVPECDFAIFYVGLITEKIKLSNPQVNSTCRKRSSRKNKTISILDIWKRAIMADVCTVAICDKHCIL